MGREFIRELLHGCFRLSELELGAQAEGVVFEAIGVKDFSNLYAANKMPCHTERDEPHNKKNDSELEACGNGRMPSVYDYTKAPKIGYRQNGGFQ
jgi:hypothetical protein